MIVVGLEPAIPACEHLLLVQEDVSEPLRQLGAEPRWTPAEELRVPLALFRTLPGETLSLLVEQVRLIARTEGEPEFAVAGSRFLPSDDVPRLLVADLDPCPALQRLRDRVRTAAGQLGLEADPDPWLAAIRVGRLQTPDSFMPLRGVLGDPSTSGSVSTRARELVVWEIRGGKTPWSKVLARAEFGTGA